MPARILNGRKNNISEMKNCIYEIFIPHSGDREKTQSTRVYEQRALLQDIVDTL